MHHKRGIIHPKRQPVKLPCSRMINSIQIKGYRALSDFEMSGLKRVNLLVGTNNSGKTSVLEAIHLLTSKGDPLTLWQLLWRRGERLAPLERNPERQVELDVANLFTGHDAHLGSKFTVVAKNESPERKIAFAIGEMKVEPAPTAGKPVPVVPSRLGLHISGSPTPPLPQIALSRNGGIMSDALDYPRRLRRRGGSEEEIPVQFITSDSLDGSDLIGLWDKIALTPSENRVLVAMNYLEEGIERIAAQSSGQSYFERGGFIIKIKGRDHPIPIGSMGDGMWRMMAMAIAVAHCRGGVLLIDEIDTGLHYSVMCNMWRLIFGAAKDLDVQIFATTHSSDCIKSLADLCYLDSDVANSVTLQRIERGKPKSVPYSAREIEIAAERQIEVR